MGPTGGSVSVTANVSRGKRDSWVIEEGGSPTRITVQQLVADGTLRIDLNDGTSLELPLNDTTRRKFFDYSERLIDPGTR